MNSQKSNMIWCNRDFSDVIPTSVMHYWPWYLYMKHDDITGSLAYEDLDVIGIVLLVLNCGN